MEALAQIRKSLRKLDEMADAVCADECGTDRYGEREHCRKCLDMSDAVRRAQLACSTLEAVPVMRGIEADPGSAVEGSPLFERLLSPTEERSGLAAARTGMRAGGAE